MRTLWFVLLIAGCESKIDKLDKAVDRLSEQVDNNKVSKALDKLDSDDAKQHLASARAAINKGGTAAEDCSWLARGESKSAPDAIKELEKLCAIEVPFGRASHAVVAAEKAKAEQPEAPSLTECSSDEWAAGKRKLDELASAESRWMDLKARWAKVCPDAK
jgi:hypothetical protein